MNVNIKLDVEHNPTRDHVEHRIQTSASDLVVRQSRLSLFLENNKQDFEFFITITGCIVRVVIETRADYAFVY